MHRLSFPSTLGASLILLVVGSASGAHAQRHSLGSSPPTAPAPPPAVPHPAGLPATPQAPVAAVSAGMGAIQFSSASIAVPAPQALTRQIESEDEHVRANALSSLGAPAAYLAHGHPPFPHAIQLDLVQLTAGEEIDALLTVELEEHILTAVLVPDHDAWRRVATLSFATSLGDAGTTPSSFMRPLRSWLEPDRYRASFHAAVNGPAGDFTENEADLRVVNGHAHILISFVSGARECDVTGQIRPPHQTCEVIQRWLEPDPTDPTRHFTLITGVGHMSAHEADDPLSRSRNYRLTRLRSFACQPFVFSESNTHFEPTANASPCAVHEPPRTEHP